jgi:DNA topoisomerase-3
METAGNDSFDEDTEKKGLGTPATRASMIEKLVSNQYLQRKGKQLIPTEDGMALVEILPSSLKSPSFTAYWENSLMNIERGTYEPEAFIGGIMTQVM